MRLYPNKSMTALSIRIRDKDNNGIITIGETRLREPQMKMSNDKWVYVMSLLLNK